MSAPCKDCTKRVLGCHSSCKDYAEYRKGIDKANGNKSWHREYGTYRATVRKNIYGKRG